MPDTLIIIPCLNEESYIEALVQKLVADTESIHPHIVIADGMSSDKTPEIAKKLAETYSNVSVISNPKKLQSAAINLAVETFGHTAEYIIRIDAHADYPADFCQTLLNEANQTGAASVVVSMNTVGKDGFQKAVAAAQNSKLGNGGSDHRNTNGEGKWVDHGHHALMSVDAFKSVGGYDENFSHNEDAELDIRLTQAGYKIWLTAKTILTYYPRSTASSLFRQYFKFGEGRARTVFKHKIKPRARQMAPLVVAPAAVLFLFSGIFMLPLVAWAGICLGYGVLLAQRAQDNDIYASGFAIMIMHFAWSCGFWNYMFRYFVFGKK